MYRAFLSAIALSFSAVSIAPISIAQDAPERPQQHGERPPPPDLSEAAEKLGISEDDLHAAMRASGGPPPDLAKAAEILGISEEDLKAVLPEPRHRPRKPE